MYVRSYAYKLNKFTFSGPVSANILMEIEIVNFCVQLYMGKLIITLKHRPDT